MALCEYFACEKLSCTSTFVVEEDSRLKNLPPGRLSFPFLLGAYELSYLFQTKIPIIIKSKSCYCFQKINNMLADELFQEWISFPISNCNKLSNFGQMTKTWVTGVDLRGGAPLFCRSGVHLLVFAETASDCVWLPMYCAFILKSTTCKNVNFPVSKPPNLNTLSMFLCAKRHNFPPNTNISWQGASHIPFPTFPTVLEKCLHPWSENFTFWHVILYSWLILLGYYCIQTYMKYLIIWGFLTDLNFVSC